jgi:hypothetical protein
MSTHDVQRARARARVASHNIPANEGVQVPVANDKPDETAGAVDLSTSINAMACAWAALAPHESGRAGFAPVDGLMGILPVKFAGR